MIDEFIKTKIKFHYFLLIHFIFQSVDNLSMLTFFHQSTIAMLTLFSFLKNTNFSFKKFKNKQTTKANNVTRHGHRYSLFNNLIHIN